MEQQIRFCKAEDGVRIAYSTVGDGFPLINANGWPGVLELFRQYPQGEGVAYLEAVAKVRMFVPYDRRRCGESERAVDDLSLEATIKDISAVADQLELEAFDLMGSADAAPIAIAYAARNPRRVSRLMLWAPFARGADLAPTNALEGIVGLVLSNWSLARRSIADIVYPSGPTELQRWYARLLGDTISPEVAAACIRQQGTVDVSHLLHLVEAPTLVLHCRRDRNIPIKEGSIVASSVQDGRLVPFEGDLDTPVGNPDVVAAMVEFLTDGAVKPRATNDGDTHTILFTDMQSSTKLADRLGDDAAQEVRRAHNDIVRAALAANSGNEIKHTGDGIMASFATASSALDAAIAIQRGVAEHKQEHPDSPLGVYIGLNAGEPIAEEDPDGRVDLFGTSVNLAARICDHAEAGQILAANVVRELAAGKQFLFSDLGETELRGFEDPIKLWELRWEEGP